MLLSCVFIPKSGSELANIDILLRLGRQKGPTADLQQRLEYLLDSCSHPVSQQSDLFRLTHAIEYLKSQGWVNAVLADEEWVPETLSSEYANVSALLVRKSELQRHFTDEGKQTALVEFVVAGEGHFAGEAFNARELPYLIQEQHTGWCILALLPAYSGECTATLQGRERDCNGTSLSASEADIFDMLTGTIRRVPVYRCDGA